MKKRLSIVLAFILLATAIVTLEVQLRCTQIELQGSADVADELCLAIQHMTVQAVHKTSEKASVPDTFKFPDRHDSK